MKLSLRSLTYWLALPALVSVGVAAPAPAHAHFKLLGPGSWVMEDAQGNPQKAGPCGPDDGSGGMMTNEITEVKAGDMVMVDIQETIHHTGWFRISLAENRSEFEDIQFTGAGCTYDMSTVPKEPHGNVLVDGMEMDTNQAGSNRHIMQMVKIPDKPCEKCTLQVIQVMADAFHQPPGCIYYHCADLKITGSGAGQAAAGSGGSTAATSGSAGMGAAAAAGSSAAGSSATTGAAGGTAGAAASSTTTTTTTTTAAAGTGGSSAASKPATTTTTTTSSGSAGSTGSSTSGASKPASSSAAAGTAAKTDAATAAATPASSSDDGGCSVAQSTTASDLRGVLWVAAAALLLGARRKRQRA